MNILDLRTALETTLVDVLGTYKLANGIMTPAIAVRDMGESLQAGTKVTGLECIILREPELEPIRQYAYEQSVSRWTLFLVLWEESDISLQEIAGRLLWAYPGSTAVGINVQQNAGPKHQIRIELRTNPDPIVP